MNYQRNMAGKTQQTLELNQVYQVNPRHLETERKLLRKFSASSKQKHQLLLGCAGSSTAILVAKATRTSSPGLSPWLMSPDGPGISSNLPVAVVTFFSVFGGIPGRCSKWDVLSLTLRLGYLLMCGDHWELSRANTKYQRKFQADHSPGPRKPGILVQDHAGSCRARCSLGFPPVLGYESISVLVLAITQQPVLYPKSFMETVQVQFNNV